MIKPLDEWIESGSLETRTSAVYFSTAFTTERMFPHSIIHNRDHEMGSLGRRDHVTVPGQYGARLAQAHPQRLKIASWMW